MEDFSGYDFAMPESRNKVLDLLVKVDRAHKHLTDLESTMNQFFGIPYPYEIFFEDDSLKR